MTFRRVMLVVLPLLAAGFVFMILWRVYIDWETSWMKNRPEPDVGPSKRLVGVEEMPMREGVRHGVSENVNLMRRDRDGNLTMQFLADRIEHQQRNTADVIRPRIQFFTRRGEVITLLADQATAVTRGSLMNMDDIESGRLWGHVVLVHDRGTPDDFADDLLVTLDDLVFDNATYEMHTDGPVILSGDRVALTARKMRLTMDRETRDINTMTFLEDIFITIQTDRRMQLGLTAPADETPSPAAPAPPATGAAAAPAAVAGAAADDGGDVWRIDLAGDVLARQDAQSIRCEHLTLYNRSRDASGPAGQGGEAPGARAARPASAQPAVASPRSAAGATEAGAEEQPGSLTIIADGPLMVTPIGKEELPALGDEVNRVTATGAPVRIEDGETILVGMEVRYNTRTGSGSVLGKDRPMRLEQPGRLRLTGGRLDFDRTAATAEVTGAGALHAQVESSSLIGVRASATQSLPETPAAPKPPSTLDASWGRSMALAFFSLPSGKTDGMGEIRRAEFHGKARVAQDQGELRGEDLAIDFFPAAKGRGQSVERLTGKGNVYVRNTPPPDEPAAPAEGATAAVPGGVPAKAAKKDSSLVSAAGDITCQDLDMQFVRDAAGDTQPKRMKASGAVAINDPDGGIRAEDLTVEFGPDERGRMDARFLDAVGNVLVDRKDLHAEGDHVLRDTRTGQLLLEGRPATAKRGESRVVGPRIEFNEADGRASVTGAGELEMPATTDLRGQPRAKPEPLLVRWQNGMLFEDKRNFAQFDGKVHAATGSSRLDAGRLWIYFQDRPPEAAAPAAVAATPGAAPAPATEKPAANDAMGEVFGRKALVRVLAEQEVRAVEEQLDADAALRFCMELTGENLTYLEENRKAYIRGPGVLRILSREKPQPGDVPTPALKSGQAQEHWLGDMPVGYGRTLVGWTETMAFDGASQRAYFKGGVQTVHGGRGIPGGDARARRDPTITKLRCEALQVVFGEKAPAAADATSAAAPVVPQSPAAAPSPETPPEERMTVDKLVADDNVFLWVDNRRGSCARLLYQREPEMIRLYRGPEDWARLWQQDEATQEFGEIVARTITYDPSTGRVDVVDQQAMTVGPRPKVEPKPLPRLVPGGIPESRPGLD